MLYNYENAIQLYICIFIFTYYMHSFKNYHAPFSVNLVSWPDDNAFSIRFLRILEKSKKIFLIPEKNSYLLIAVPSYETNHHFQLLTAHIFNISASNCQRQRRLKPNEIRFFLLSVSMSSCSLQAGGCLQRGSPILASSSHFLPSFIPVNRLAISAGRGAQYFCSQHLFGFCTDEYLDKLAGPC